MLLVPNESERDLNEVDDGILSNREGRDKLQGFQDLVIRQFVERL